MQTGRSPKTFQRESASSPSVLPASGHRTPGQVDDAVWARVFPRAYTAEARLAENSWTAEAERDAEPRWWVGGSWFAVDWVPLYKLWKRAWVPLELAEYAGSFQQMSGAFSKEGLSGSLMSAQGASL